MDSEITKIVIFGTGNFYKRRKQYLPVNVEIVAFIDNNEILHNEYCDGSKILLPREITNLKYDYVVLASGVSHIMRAQLLELGVEPAKIKHWEEFVADNSRGVVRKYAPNAVARQYKNRTIIITNIINYAGGFVAAYYLAQALVHLEHRVVICAAVGDESIVDEFLSNGIEIWICPSLQYAGCMELEWINAFDYIVCNTISTIVCASRAKPQIAKYLWIHEQSSIYPSIMEQFGTLIDIDGLQKTRIYAVSQIAKDNFERYFPPMNVGIMPVGISEVNNASSMSKNDFVTIVTVGNISPLKNQIGLVNAIELLNRDVKERVRCFVVGRSFDGAYYTEFCEVISDKSNIQYLGEKGRSDTQKYIDMADIVVCASNEETLSLAIVEGMMHKKICVTSDNTGVASYIEDGKNGFIFENGNVESLSDILDTIVRNISSMDSVRGEAYKTYCTYFSMDALIKRILDVDFRTVIAIPTYNSLDNLRIVLEKNYRILTNHNCDIYLYDSSENDDTRNYVFKEYNFPNVFYKRIDSSVRSNEKVFMIYEELSAEYEYLWMNRDSTWFDDELVECIFQELTTHNPDIVYIEGTPNEYLTIEYDSVTDFFEKANCGMTFFGSTIINTKTLLSDVDWNYYRSKYLDSECWNFSHVGFQIEQSTRLKVFQGVYLGFPTQYRHYTKTESTWYPEIVRIWSCCWVSLIDKLAESLQLDSDVKNKILCSPPDRFRDDFLILYRALGWYDMQKYELYCNWIIRISSVRQVRLKEIALMTENEAYDACVYYVKKMVESAVSGYDKIVIYGAGKYGKNAARILELAGVSIDGYIVTNVDNQNASDDAKIYALTEYLFTDKVGIILGLGIINRVEVCKRLEECGLSQNICYEFDKIDYRYGLLLNDQKQ